MTGFRLPLIIIATIAVFILFSDRMGRLECRIKSLKENLKASGGVPAPEPSVQQATPAQ